MTDSFGVERSGRALGVIIMALCGLMHEHELMAAEAAPAKAPSVFLWDGNYLSKTRLRIWSGETNFAPALAALEKDAKEALKAEPFSVMEKSGLPPSGDKHDFMSQAPYYWPDPKSPDGRPYIRRDGERNPEIYKIVDRRNLGRMGSAVQTLALAYYYTTNEVHADKAARLLRAWFLDPATRMNPNFEFAQAVPGENTGRGTGLIEAAGLTGVVDAIGLLAGSKAWTKRDQAGMEEWFSKFVQWMLESKNGRAEAAAQNNHGTYYDVQVVSYSLFVGKAQQARQIVEAARQKRIGRQVEPDGRQPLELRRTRSWSYSLMNLRGLFSLATLGDDVGVDLWNYRAEDGRSIRVALDFLAPYGLKEKKWPYPQLGQFAPEELLPLLRRAGLVYHDSKYAAEAAQFSEEKSGDRERLVRPGGD
jgi:hypothetical protein